MAPITIAIAGGTGNLGKPLTKAILKGPWYPNEVGRVLVITRDPNSAAAQELKADGAEIVVASTINAEALKGVDVLVNAVTAAVPAEEKNNYAQAAVDADVKVYIPNNFGIDHRPLDFDHVFTSGKVAHGEYARSIGRGKLKVVSFLTEEFLEYAIMLGPLMGMDFKNRTFTAVGDPKAKGTFTSLGDIGRAVARGSILAIQDPSSVPEYVRISGDALSFQDIADIVTKLTGDKVEVKTIDVADFRKTLKTDDPNHFIPWLRVALGKGWMNFSGTNDNELINPGETFWKWKKLEPFLEENKAQWQ